jgi:hypothetical protein
MRANQKVVAGQLVRIKEDDEFARMIVEPNGVADYHSDFDERDDVSISAGTVVMIVIAGFVYMGGTVGRASPGWTYRSFWREVCFGAQQTYRAGEMKYPIPDTPPVFVPGQLIVCIGNMYYSTPLDADGNHMNDNMIHCPRSTPILYLGLDPTIDVNNFEGEWGIVIFDGRKFSVCLKDFIAYKDWEDEDAYI